MKRSEKQPCPNCGHILEVHSPLLDKKAKPKPNDISICICCLYILTYDQDLNLSLCPVEVLEKIEKEEPKTWEIILKSIAFLEKENEKSKKRMNLEEAVDKIYAPKSKAALVFALKNDDFAVLDTQQGRGANIEKVNEMIVRYEKEMKDCKDDFFYWQILSDLTYWKAVKKLHEAHDLNNGVLAFVDTPVTNTIVMEAIGNIEAFGNKVFERTKKLKDKG